MSACVKPGLEYKNPLSHMKTQICLPQVNVQVQVLVI